MRIVRAIRPRSSSFDRILAPALSVCRDDPLLPPDVRHFSGAAVRVADSTQAQPRKHEKRSRNGIRHAHVAGVLACLRGFRLGMTGVELQQSPRRV